MHRTRSLLAIGAVLALVACNNNPPPRSSPAAGSAPLGTTPDGRSAATPQPAGSGGINRGYYQGTDPNFPRGSSGGGSRSN